MIVYFDGAKLRIFVSFSSFFLLGIKTFFVLLLILGVIGKYVIPGFFIILHI